MNARKISAILLGFVFAIAIPLTAHADAGPDGSSAQPAAVSTPGGKGADRGGVSVAAAGVPTVITIPTANLFQCPFTNCNFGVANAQNYPIHHDAIVDICFLPGSTTPWGGYWDMVYDYDIQVVGFISSTFLTNLTLTTC